MWNGEIEVGHYKSEQAMHRMRNKSQHKRGKSKLEDLNSDSNREKQNKGSFSREVITQVWSHSGKCMIKDLPHWVVTKRSKQPRQNKDQSGHIWSRTLKILHSKHQLKISKR